MARRFFRIVIGLAIGATIAAAFVFFIFLPPRADARLNVVIAHEPYEISPDAKALHESLRVADLHDDMLMWARDPMQRHKRGHTDIPRLVEGGVRMQVFSAVTKSPKNLNYEHNDSDSDQITLLAIAQRWPVRTWNSLAERALYQAGRLAEAERRSNGAVRVARTRADLEAALDAGALVGVLATEGAHPLEGDLANLDRLYDAGYRVLGLQHFFDNELGGSLHGMSGAGLTAFGREAVKAAEARGMIIDVAHSSQAVARDVLAMTSKPIIVSHTGLKGHCDSPRNFPDDLLNEIAARGGLVGIGFWDGAVCKPDLEHIAAAIVYAVGLLGADHVALGSDFDGTTTVPFDASEYAALTDALLAAGLDEETIRAVMGENVIRFFLENLP
ncbi:MAG: membrane dipeptidase [Pseudomonadota bacterium]|nr:membrane dipeptidase [Pseudomonadota bacterium]